MTRLMFAVVLTLAVAVSAVAQTGIPSKLSKGEAAALSGAGVGIGSRAMGMGGAAVATTADPTAMYWNPAALGLISGMDFAFPVGASANGIDAIEDISDLWALYEDGGQDWSVDEFTTAFDIVRDLGGRDIRGTAAAMAGISVPMIKGLTVGAFGEGGFDASFNLNAAGAAPAVGDTISAAGRALYYYSIGAGYGRQISPNTSLGITVRSMQVDRYNVRYDGTLTSPTTVVTAQNYNHLDDNGFAVDLGMLAKAQDNLTAGVVIRNLYASKLSLARTVGGAIQDVTIDPTVNIGLAANVAGILWAFDIHNVFGGNDGDATLHFGGEKWLGNSLAVRAGFTQDCITVGLGGKIGPASIDLAVDTGFENRASLAVGLDF